MESESAPEGKGQLQALQPPRRVGDIGVVKCDPDGVRSPDDAALVRLGSGGLDESLIPPSDERAEQVGGGARVR